MSVIQTIRNKYIGLVIGAIVIALIGFLVMDAMQSNVKSIFGNDQTLLASINGKRVEYKEFAAMQAQYEENIKSRSKEKTITEEERNQATEQAWNDLINETLIAEESEKLGIDLTEKELQDMLYSPYADPMIQQSFSDPNTGVFDPSRVSQYLGQLGQDKTGAQRAQWKDFQDAIMKTRRMTKYTDMITKGIYMPTFMMNEMTKQQSAVSSISYVQIPYTSISDSLVQVTDAELQDYMKKNEKLFTSLEANARVEYVTFDIIPSGEDTAASLGVLDTIKADFAATTEIEEFIAKNSEESMKDFYYNEKTLAAVNPLEIINSPIGSVTGPFYMGDGFKMIRVLDKKQMPDSVRASHILIAVGEQRTEEQAKASIDSIEMMVNTPGVDFGQIAAMRSEDQGSGKKGGDMGYFAQGTMVPEFNDVCFNGKVGDLKKVKTQFGWHLIKVTDQKDFKPSVKIAVVSKALTPGNATMQATFAKANDFIAKAKDIKTFTETAKTMGKDKRIADRLTNTQRLVQGLGNARELTRWAFDAKIGAISPIINLENKCIVANLISRQDKGTMPDAASIRPQLENILKREKKVKMLADKYKAVGSLEEIASATQTQVLRADTLFYSGGGSEIGKESRVVGAAFNKNLLNKVSPGIGGDMGVYFIKVNNITDGKPSDPTMLFMQKMQMEQQITSQAAQIIPYVLKRNADIVDNRGNFF